MECLENYDYMYLIGDLNLPEIDSTSFDLDNSSSKAKIIGHLMSHYDLFSINNIRNINNITLDLVLTNMVDATVDVSGLGLTDISDKNHPPLDITFLFENSHVSINKSEVGNSIYNFKKDFIQFITCLVSVNGDMFDLDDVR
ncbi:hypothetical protein JTB14_031629 [Gonioctena quinquepunctata]|nr:hypothetical protein JTB14_031629 [Gonioctena quinquepunctata]